MISQITGILVQKEPQFVVLVTGGIGYEIEVPMSTYFELPKLGNEVKLITFFHVREDNQKLYGFNTFKEKLAFKNLIKVNGIGPKVALAVLSGLSVSQLAKSIEDNQIENIIKIPGIGKKTAERMLVELREKFQDLYQGDTSKSENKTELTKALISLGYSDKEIKITINDISLTDSLEQNIKLALRNFAK